MKTTTEKTTIIQIIPCTVPLFAKFKDDPPFTDPVVCFALIETEFDDEFGAYRQIVGCTACEGEIDPVTGSSNFDCYVREPIVEKDGGRK